MGRGRVARHGESSAAAARFAQRIPAAGIRHGLSAGRHLLLSPVLAVRMAAAVFYRWIARAAGAVCAHAREGIGGLGEDEARDLGPARARHRVALEALPVPRIPHDGDELRLARHAGYVPDFPGAPVALRRHGPLRGYG